MKKRVLFVIDSLTCGGAEKSLVSLLPLLNREKYELCIWMRMQGGAFAPLLPQDVQIVNNPKYCAFEALCLKIGQLMFSFKLRWNKIIKKQEHLAETLWKCQGWAMKVPEGKWDIVVAYQQGVPTYLVADKFRDCKKLAWVNVDIFNAGYSTSFNKHFYQKFDDICPVSDALHKMLSNKLPEFTNKYNTIWDIINPDVTRKLAEETCENLKKKNNECVLVTTGRLVPQKGYDIAIAAAAVLKQKGVYFKWYFIGEGPERSKIEAAIKEQELENNVILLGLQTNPFKFMTQADVYVQTSKWEGFGMTIAEAKILGKPVVSTNFEVVNNQITNGVNGLIAEMNGESVAEAIYRMITDSHLRNSIIESVKKENFTRHITECKKVEQLFDE